MAAAAQAADALEDQQRREETEKMRDLRAAWRAQSDRTKRAEYDLSDPSQRRKDEVPRLSATQDLNERDAARLGPSSAQVFAGEAMDDPSIKARLREELLRDNDALLADKARREQARKDAESAYAASVAAAAATADQLDAQLKGEHHLDTGTRLMRENAVLARERKRREAEEKEREERERLAELEAIRRDSRLAEGRAAGYDARDGRRPRKDHFKGFSVEDVDAVRREQERQRQENAARRAEEAARKAAADRALLAACAAADSAAASMDSDRTREQLRYAAELRAQQREANARKRRDLAQRKERYDETAGGVLSGFGKHLR